MRIKYSVIFNNSDDTQEMVAGSWRTLLNFQEFAISRSIPLGLLYDEEL